MAEVVAQIAAERVREMLYRDYDSRVDHAPYDDVVRKIADIFRDAMEGEHLGLRQKVLDQAAEIHDLQDRKPAIFDVLTIEYDSMTKDTFLLLTNGDRLRLPELLAQKVWGRERRSLSQEVETLKTKLLGYETMGAVEAVARPLVNALKEIRRTCAPGDTASEIAKRALDRLQRETINELDQEPQEQPDIDKLREIRDDLARAIVDLKRLALQGTPTADLYATASATMGILLAHISNLCSEGVV